MYVCNIFMIFKIQYQLQYIIYIFFFEAGSTPTFPVLENNPTESGHQTNQP